MEMLIGGTWQRAASGRAEEVTPSRPAPTRCTATPTSSSPRT